MRPLLWIAVGLVVVLLSADTRGGWDLLPDPLGWVLVVVGTVRLPAQVGARGAVRLLAVVALAVATPTWIPSVGSRVADADPAVVWVLGLAQVGYVVVLAHALAGAAAIAGRRRDATWWRVARTVTAVVALLPAVVIGGGVQALRGPGAALTVAAALLVLVLLARHAGRPWAREPAEAAETTTGPPP